MPNLGKQFSTYHCSSPKVLDYAKIDTSICAVFYVWDKTELIGSLIPALKEYCKAEDSLFQFYEHTPVFSQLDATEDAYCKL